MTDKNTDLAKIFGYTLRQLRDQRTISQEKFAELCGLDRTFISRLERGTRQPTLETMMRIADALDMPLNQLITAFERRHAEHSGYSVPPPSETHVIRDVDPEIPNTDSIQVPITRRELAALTHNLTKLQAFIESLYNK